MTKVGLWSGCRNTGLKQPCGTAAGNSSTSGCDSRPTPEARYRKKNEKRWAYFCITITALISYFSVHFLQLDANMNWK